MGKEIDEFRARARKGINDILFNGAQKHYSPYSPDTVKELLEFVFSLVTDTRRIAVVFKNAHMSDCAVNREYAEPAGFCNCPTQYGWVLEDKSGGECPLCGKPSEDGEVHKECADYENSI